MCVRECVHLIVRTIGHNCTDVELHFIFPTEMTNHKLKLHAISIYLNFQKKSSKDLKVKVQIST